jgi:hypothetical protein
MAMKHGFDSAEAYKKEAQDKFSLLKNGILEMPSTRLLLINVGGKPLFHKSPSNMIGRELMTDSCLSKTR